MKEDTDNIIKIRIAITLRQLLRKKGVPVEVSSYNDIAIVADLRKATVTDAFNANTACKGVTLFLIINAMGYSVTEFGKVYDSILDSEITQFVRGIHPTQRKK
ncbi:hypothetical protein [Flavobacterium suaedae]|uniref:hypothetical protein n=1 Tax=Flavobacterium suaedae TaxID=1767027 RepID=UPI00166BB771|nr:hypothetical protein [Flavobacterium suaedae]